MVDLNLRFEINGPLCGDIDSAESIYSDIFGNFYKEIDAEWKRERNQSVYPLGAVDRAYIALK